jgi:hypothetical protein
MCSMSTEMLNLLGETASTAGAPFGPRVGPSLTRVTHRVNRLRAHFTCCQIVELLLTIGCNRMLSRLVTLLQLELEPLFGVDSLRRAHESTVKHR